MKPTSVVFLVIAALLIVGGVLLCTAAKDIALTDNYTLFNTSEDGGTYVRHDFNDADISKIELLLTDAEVSVHTGAEEAYIEFINFRDGLYTLSTSGKVISLDEMPDLKSIFSLESGFSFSGMRYILQAGGTSLGPKQVNIYLTQEAALKILSIDAENCTFNASELHTACDIQLHAEETLTLNASEIRTGCTLDLSAQTAAISLQNSTFNAVKLSAQAADIDTDSLIWERMTLALDRGKATLSYASTIPTDRMIVTDSGTLYLNGVKTPLPLYTADPAPLLQAQLGSAELYVNWATDAAEE